MYNVQLLSCLLSARWDVMRSGRFARFGEDGSSLVQPFTNLPQNLGLLDNNNDRYQRALRGEPTLSLSFGSENAVTSHGQASSQRHDVAWHTARVWSSFPLLGTTGVPSLLVKLSSIETSS